VRLFYNYYLKAVLVQQPRRREAKAAQAGGHYA